MIDYQWKKPHRVPPEQVFHLYLAFTSRRNKNPRP